MPRHVASLTSTAVIFVLWSRSTRSGTERRWTPAGAHMAELPVIALPVGADDDALDACLAALDAGTPPGTRIWLADDAQAGPRGLAIIERWLASPPLQAACFARDASIASATPWCNAGEVAAWPRIGEVAPMPGEPDRLARACAAMPPLHPELPAAVAHAVMLRGSARGRAGGLDAASYGS